MQPTLTVDCDFPGGNIILEKVEGDTIFVRQDLRDTTGNWFYWYFRVRGAAGRVIRVNFIGSTAIGARGPGISLDAGRTWRWLGADACTDKSFRCQAPPDVAEIRFSMGMPYLEADLNAFLDRHRNHPSLEQGVLCKTPQGRSVELLRLGRLDGSAEHRLVLTSRHHCCEMMANYVLEGLMETVLADATTGAWLRDHTEMLIIPFVDKDGVEQGDQGKNRAPHDHNRDYTDNSLYAEVRAIRDLVPKWSGQRLRMLLDIHCPYLLDRNRIDRNNTSGRNESIFFPGCSDPVIWERTKEFSRILSECATDSLPHLPEDNLPFGEGWNKPDAYAKGRGCKFWASTLPGILIAATLEVAYANARGQEVNADTARAFGRDLARAMHAWLTRVYA